MLGEAIVQLLLVGSVAAQAGTATGIVNPTVAASTATHVPTASGYSYVGCYNETVHLKGSDGSRALSGGSEITSNVMTVELCLSQYSSGQGAPMQFAGLEYGRECYCAQYVDKFSGKINETSCDYACNGNSSQLCGGPDALTLYNMTSQGRTGGGSRPNQDLILSTVVCIGLLSVTLA